MEREGVQIGTNLFEFTASIQRTSICDAVCARPGFGSQKCESAAVKWPKCCTLLTGMWLAISMRSSIRN